MNKVTEMNREIFRHNLLLTIKEIREVDISMAQFKIVPKHEPGKPLSSVDDQMRLIALSEKNIGSRLLSFEDATRLLSCNTPLVPIWINVSDISDNNLECAFLLETSLRFRKPSLLGNAETGHPPFKAII